jgi:hypothetical protein
MAIQELETRNGQFRIANLKILGIFPQARAWLRILRIITLCVPQPSEYHSSSEKSYLHKGTPVFEAQNANPLGQVA